MLCFFFSLFASIKYYSMFTKSIERPETKRPPKNAEPDLVCAYLQSRLAIAHL